MEGLLAGFGIGIEMETGGLIGVCMHEALLCMRNEFLSIVGF